MIKIKRIYQEAEKNDGYRVLVDRIWPRGISKERAQLDLWLKQVAPSTELRKWFNHDETKFSEFKTRYLAELAEGEAASALMQLKEIVATQDTVTLLYGAKDQVDNQAVVLKEVLEK
ncbi:MULTISPECIES: DUF488 domain-containing protein [Enterococcus]|uniref:DUF488 domain-containing protein n=1 Tax=Enterococcus alishanensis TaxID=1303817 RepID=A0ABS6TAK4_9ENTE|nr:DUF488 domain-containing protein [Enterococcus alishanensis]MBV7389941.1 DUF488 domain-containing protein [Enterococcus alishanensis]